MGHDSCVFVRRIGASRGKRPKSQYRWLWLEYGSMIWWEYFQVLGRNAWCAVCAELIVQAVSVWWWSALLTKWSTRDEPYRHRRDYLWAARSRSSGAPDGRSNRAWVLGNCHQDCSWPWSISAVLFHRGIGLGNLCYWELSSDSIVVFGWAKWDLVLRQLLKIGLVRGRTLFENGLPEHHWLRC